MRTGIDIRQLRRLVIAPALRHLGLHSPAAEELLVGTALQESGGGHWLAQLGGGPGLGIFQMEPATARDIWDNFLAFRPDLAAKIRALMIPGVDDLEELTVNLRYAAAMVRIHYLRVKAPLPPAGDVEAQARYWKRYYNTAGGKGTEAAFAANWRRAFA